MLNPFEEIRTRLDMPTVATTYGIHPDRHGMVQCPFHDDRRASAKLYQERLRCFMCGDSWDSVALVGKLYGLKPIEAARRISDDFNLGLFPDKPPTAAERRKAAEATRKRKSDRVRLEAFEAWEQWACNTIAEYIRLLESWMRDFAPKAPEDDINPLFAEACRKLDYYDYLYTELFISGCFSAKEEFYKTQAKEVETVAQWLDDSGQNQTA